MAENDKFIKSEKKKQSQQIYWNDVDDGGDDDDKRKGRKKEKWEKVKRLCFAFGFISIVLCAKCKVDKRKNGLKSIEIVRPFLGMNSLYFFGC